jgi:ribose transport system permease protein
MRDRAVRIVTERPSSFAVALAIGLLIANVIAQPDFIAPNQIAPTLGTMAPFVIVGMASTLAFLSGGGGIDLSIAPLMGLVNIILVTVLFGTAFGGPVLAVPILLALGALVGAINGVMVARLRYPPVIATLGMFFVLAGLDLRLVPNPVTASGDNWTNHLAGSIGPLPGAVLTIGLPLLLWIGLRRTPYVQSLLAVGDHDATAFSAGMDVNAVRISAYAIGGLIAAVGGIALTGLVRSADAQVFNNYILVALAAVALGGTNLMGGRGGLFPSMMGAVCIFLLENLLTSLHASAYFIEVAYGGVLFIAVLFGARLFNRPAPA